MTMILLGSALCVGPVGIMAYLRSRGPGFEGSRLEFLLLASCYALAILGLGLISWGSADV